MSEETSLPSTAERLDLENISRAEFVNALVHLYRGELSEATAWRSRIDTTTNWAVVLSATALTFVFSDKSADRHVVIPLISMFTTFFLLMEARRYRFFDIWRSRARMLEINFFRPMLDVTQNPTPEWAETLAHDMEWPHFHMPWWEAVGRRLRRNYQWIFAIQLASWVMVLISHPTPTTDLAEVMSRAAVGPIPGPWVMVGVAIFYGGLASLGVYSRYASHRRKQLPAGHPGRMVTLHNE